jgi:hypothetical protein
VPVGKGYVLGATLTTSSRYGYVLIAFLAIFVSWTGIHLWNIICFGIHQLRSSPDRKDGVHHQIQALLHSGLTDMAMLWQFSRMSWYWKKRTTKVWHRMAPLMFTCATHFAIITVAGLFSSRISDAAGEVLVKSTGICGWYSTSFANNQSAVVTEGNFDSLDSLIAYTRSAVSQAKQYSQTCYPRINGFSPDTSSATCSYTTVPFLQSNVNNSAICPFALEACDGPAISFDSGLLDSHTHLGINASPRDRVQFRRLMTCVPVPIDKKYSSAWLESPLSPGTALKPYFLGQAINGREVLDNATFLITNFTLPFSEPYSPT